MTEAEWAGCAEPGPMLAFLRGRVSDRKLRLFACACCRTVQGFIPVGPCRAAVEVALRYADGRATADELAAARSAAVAVADSAAAWAGAETANPSALLAARAAADEAREHVRRLSPRAGEEEARAQADLLRDVIGNPFRPVTAEPFRWLARHPLVQEIAEEVYAGAPQEDMTALAEELQALGCPHPGVLEHCRAAAPHIRGCWVIDLILGKEAGPATAKLAEPAEPVPSPKMPAPGVQEIRRALAEVLGPKKYRRFLRKALKAGLHPGRVSLLDEWATFFRTNPGYDLPDAKRAEVCAVCPVHGCELLPREVCSSADDPQLLCNNRFLSARGSAFPCSYAAGGEEGEAEWRIWWCPECQRARAEWMR
jgi:hypothetical protein